MDQAEMSFYPEIFPLEGIETRLPNLLVPLTMARSWAARGVLAADPEQGLEDCRRAIRLGRLLRQEDVVLISDLVGLACIHVGARGVYEIARRTGDTELALLASVVIGEVAPQRLYSSQRLTEVDVSPFLHRQDEGSYTLDAPDALVDRIVAMATTFPDRRFAGEALLGAHVVAYHGTPAQRELVRAMLDGVVSRDDPFMASLAAWSRDTRPSLSLLQEMVQRLE